MSYYGYIERENNQALDWQTIGKNLSDNLLKAGKDRQDRRDEFEQASLDYQKELDEVPSGDYKTANTFALNHATDASRARLIQDRLFKNGLMTDRQYTAARQQLRDDTKSLFGLSKEYQKEYDEKMVRFKNNESMVLESMLMENIEGLANLRDAGTFINMESGAVSIGTYDTLKDSEGKYYKGMTVDRLSATEGDKMTVNQMRNRYKERYDKFDLDAANSVIAERTGKFVTAIRTAGGENYSGNIRTILDPTQRGKDEDGLLTDAISNFEKYEKDAINGYLGNEYNKLSVLTNSIVFDENKNTYYPTLDSTLKGVVKDGKNYVLVKDDGSGTITVDFTPGQTKAAFKGAQTNFRNQLDYTESETVYTETRERLDKEKLNKTEKSEEQVISSWNTLYHGTKEQKKTAITNLLNSKIAKGVKSDGSDSILAIDITKAGEIEVSYKDPTLNEVISYDPENITQEDWARLGNFVHGVDDIDTVMTRAGGFKTGDAGTRRLGADDIDNVFANRQGGSVKESQGKAFKRILNKKFDDTQEAAIKNMVKKDGDAANDNFVGKYTDSMPAGFKLQALRKIGADSGKFVRIAYTDPNGKKVFSEDINIDGGDSMKKIRDYITKQSGTEKAMIQQALYIKNNGGRISGAKPYETRKERNGVGGAYPVDDN
ncbi:MAG: hypothetical protein GOVbin3205_16 [Prokaryotic dsDNA virus sp.]|nr:MAG: hypothetical protein GOVbin3205_16 [Prokaryotic dsDNA virus sp.]|tara:strand:+ start:1833 stop:3812 length:1980 start_codon:yes stop_codon:yes gene_type:complete